MANIMLPRIVPDKSKQVKNFLVRQGANLPPRASRRRYSVSISTDVDPKVLPDIAVVRAVKKTSVELVKFDSDSGRNSSVQSCRDFEDGSNDLLSVSGLRIQGHKTQNNVLHSDDDDEDWDENDDDDVNEPSIDPSTVHWDDFHNRDAMNENLELFLSCKKVNLSFEVAKPEYIDGYVVVPVFHCPKCLECWNTTRRLPIKCVEEAQPTRGKPLALDESANKEFLNENNINFISIKDRRKRRSKDANRKKMKRRENLVNVPYGFDVVENEQHSSNNIAELKPSHKSSIQGMRKYGGLNRSEAEMLVNRSDSSYINEEKSKRSNFSDSGKGSFDSLDTTSSSNGVHRKLRDKRNFNPKFDSVVDAAMKIEHSQSLNSPTRHKDRLMDKSHVFSTDTHLSKGLSKTGNLKTNQGVDSQSTSVDTRKKILKSIDESRPMVDMGKDLSTQSKVGFSNRLSFHPDASPSEFLSRMKHTRTGSSSFKSAASLQRNYSVTSGRNGASEKQIIPTTGGGGIQQIIDTNRSTTQKSKLRKSSIQMSSDEQYFMQGNKEAVQQRRLLKPGQRVRPNELSANKFSQMDTSGKRKNSMNVNKDNISSKSVSKQIPGNQENLTNGKLANLVDGNIMSNDDEISDNSLKSIGGNVDKNIKKIDGAIGVEPKRKGYVRSSREQMSPLSDGVRSRPSSNSHVYCLDSTDDFPYSSRLKSPSKKSSSKKMTAKERLYASLEISRRKQSMQSEKLKMFKINPEQFNGKVERTRDELTPSPKLSSRISKNEMLCMRMRQMTQAFTFSFFELPVQYKKKNEKTCQIATAGGSLKNTRRKKGKL